MDKTHITFTVIFISFNFFFQFLFHFGLKKYRSESLCDEEWPVSSLAISKLYVYISIDRGPYFLAKYGALCVRPPSFSFHTQLKMVTITVGSCHKVSQQNEKNVNMIKVKDRMGKQKQNLKKISVLRVIYLSRNLVVWIGIISGDIFT